MTHKRWLWMIVAVLLLAPLTLAGTITLEVEEAQDEIEAGSTAEFTLKITNNGLERDVFSIEADEFSIYPFSEFAQKIEAKPYQVKLDASESALVKVLIKTIDVTPPNKFYDARIVVASIIHPTEKETIDLKTYIASSKNIISVEPQLPTKLTPGKEIKIPVKIKNRSRLTMRDLEINAAIPEIMKVADPIIITLEPQEEKEIEFTINVDPAANPGMKKMTIGVYEQNELRGSFVAEIEILPKDRVEEDKDIKRSFLASTTVITRENSGNIVSKQRIEARYNLIQRIFSSMTPEPKVEQGKVIWEFNLQPGEKKTIEIKSNYRPLLYGLIIVAIFTAIILFSIERSVVVKKRIFHGKEIIEGVKAYKLFILIRNGKKYTLNDVKVMDLVPNVLDLTSDFGSLQPDRIQHGERATRLLWNVIKLEPGEERVFSYKVRRKHNIIGDIVLPTAIIQYVDDKDKFAQAQSIRVILE